MARYGQAFKDRAVARLLPPESASVETVSRELGVGVATLERWRSEALSEPSRERTWTAAARLEAVIATATMDEAGKAHQGLTFIQQLYRIEHDIKDLSAQQRHQRRQEKAKPLWEKLRSWLENSLPQVPPKSATGTALNYLHEQWPNLMRYLDDPLLPIDNNTCERAIRPFVIGRRGWLFSATV